MEYEVCKSILSIRHMNPQAMLFKLNLDEKKILQQKIDFFKLIFTVDPKLNPNDITHTPHVKGILESTCFRKLLVMNEVQQ